MRPQQLDIEPNQVQEDSWKADVVWIKVVSSIFRYDQSLIEGQGGHFGVRLNYDPTRLMHGTVIRSISN